MATSEGSNSNDKLTGGAGSDSIDGLAGDDTLRGQAGNDTLVGGAGNDILDGGSGNDILDGGAGADIYMFGKGYGGDVIAIVSGIFPAGGPLSPVAVLPYGGHPWTESDPEVNTIRLGKGIAPEDVSISSSNGRELVLNLADSTDSLRISSFSSGTDVFQVVFADGSFWDPQTLARKWLDRMTTDGADTIYGSGLADSINGGAGNDWLMGGAGYDTIDGGEGNDSIYLQGNGDTVIFGIGSGQDTVSAFSEYWFADARVSGRKTIALGAGIDEEDIILSRPLNHVAGTQPLGNDLLLSVAGGTDTLLIEGFFGSNYANPIDVAIRFADAHGWYESDLAARWLASQISAGNDVVLGTRGSDRIRALAGDDLVQGDGGDDVLSGGAGADTLWGGYGDDYLDGGSGNDILSGGQGADTYCFGVGSGHDKIISSLPATTSVISRAVTPKMAARLDLSVMLLPLEDVGPDSIVLGPGIRRADVTVKAVADGVLLSLGGSDDTLLIDKAIFGTTQFRVRFDDGTQWNLSRYAAKALASQASSGSDKLSGSAVADAIHAGGGNDSVDGGLGSDTLDGGAGRDLLQGGEGNDKIIGGAGADTMYGGDGNDTYWVDNSGDRILEDNHWVTGYRPGGLDKVMASVSFSLAASGPLNYVEILRLCSDGNIDGTGNELANTIYAGAGNNIMDGGAGRDTVSYAFAAASIRASLAKGSVAQATGGSGTDALKNFENLAGSRFNDTLAGNGGDNVLTGGHGADTLAGGGGNDTLMGGLGRDVLTGGAGSDVFAFTSISEAGKDAGARDIVTDFTPGRDRVDLFAMDADIDSLGKQEFTGLISGDAAFTQAGQLKFKGGVLYGNTDGDADAEFAVSLTGVTSLSAADLVLHPKGYLEL